ncbi:MAG: aminoglycoside phosphotransferase family protein [Prevotella sp.]|nr:aminoglycoside phosphotransferase family protein [Bacteroidales bacterium]MCI7686814.1 aminoglycoside phosphotransferase family protein [Prevotella sp.]MDD6746587.1 aminoglycoside phosphotransferase family protein [Bacteroidales bacterium]MDY3841679.1 aminoglycoside phosphotransferase family protein [Prevotella sp.]
MEEKELKGIVEKFNVEGTIASIRPLGNGLINDTYLVVTAGENDDYVLQRINNSIFQDVDLLQHNVEAVTSHIRKKLIEAGEDDISRKVLHFVETGEGKTYYMDGAGRYWRVSVFIPRAKTFEAVTPEYSYYAGKAFGNFEAMLVDLPETLGETIPDFHNMELRMRQLRDAVAQDAKGRLSEVRDIVDELESHAHEMCKAERMGREGKLPKRVCHCDTKVNNMMFDEEGRVLCVIDLDTVMPSFVFSDYGDFLRTGANFVAEDDPEIGKVGFREDIFESFTKGYLESAKSFLTPVETENLPYAVALFPYMQCVRFLTDYINGDTYYKIKYPEHNLVRTRNQLALFRCVYAKQEEMARFIASCL